MKYIPGMLEGALAVRFYHSVRGPFPIEVGAAVPGASMSAVIRPDARLAALDPRSEEELGLSLLEAEATGLSAQKVCDQLNLFFGGRMANCSSREEVEAIAGLFAYCNVELEFDLGTLDGHLLPSPACSSTYAETAARDLFARAWPLAFSQAR